MPGLYRLVELSCRAHSQDVLPAVELLNDVVHLFLRYHLLQFGGVLARRDAKEQALVELLHLEEAQQAGSCQQAGIEVVDRVAQAVV